MLVESRRKRLWATIGVVSAVWQLSVVPALAAGPSRGPSAEDLADLAYKMQEEGQYAEAIGTYTRAYEISGAGAILFNIATIYDRKLHERRLAMEYFRRYLQ